MKALSVPTILVNNIPIGIVPNSFTFKLGRGETKVRAASVGGGITTSVHTEDAEGKVGMMKWEMYVTDSTLSLVQQWKALIGENVIDVAQIGISPVSLQTASMMNDPDFEASADGKVEIQFEGDQAS